MLDFLRANVDKLVSGEFVRSDYYVYYIWGASQGCRTIYRIADFDFDATNDALYIGLNSKRCARINYFTGEITAIE